RWHSSGSPPPEESWAVGPTLLRVQPAAIKKFGPVRSPGNLRWGAATSLLYLGCRFLICESLYEHLHLTYDRGPSCGVVLADRRDIVPLQQLRFDRGLFCRQVSGERYDSPGACDVILAHRLRFPRGHVQTFRCKAISDSGRNRVIWICATGNS